MDPTLNAMFDEAGRPAAPHSACPRCGTDDEVGSYYGDAWCCYCGWHGTLDELRGRYVRGLQRT